MLIAVLSVGGAILGATTIAGLLTLYQLRASTDAEASAKAIFAADSGVEWTFFDFFCQTKGRCSGAVPLPAMSNGATVAATCYDSTGVTTVACNSASAVSAITKGTSLSTKRAFFLDLTAATATFP